jgi:hypothetical protein
MEGGVVVVEEAGPQEAGRTGQAAPQEAASVQGAREGAEVTHQILEESINKNAALGQVIEEVLREGLRRGINPETIPALIQSLQVYVSPAEAIYLLDTLSKFDDASQLDAIRQRSSDEIWAWLQRLLALFGLLVKDAIGVAGENRDSWRWLRRRTYYDLTNQRWSVFLEITKVSDERFVLDETVNSIMTFINLILDVLLPIGDGLSQEIKPDVADNFAQLAMDLVKSYNPSMLEPAAPEAADEAPDGPVDLAPEDTGAATAPATGTED